MNYLNARVTSFVLDLKARFDDNEGLSAMEYFVMMVGLIMAIYFIALMMGQRLDTAVKKFFTDAGM